MLIPEPISINCMKEKLEKKLPQQLRTIPVMNRMYCKDELYHFNWNSN